MHDLQDCKAILHVVEEESRRCQGKRVVRIRLSIGAHSDTEPEHLKETLAFCSLGTIAEGAELEVVRRPARISLGEQSPTAIGQVLCHLGPNCDSVFETDGARASNCKKCNSLQTKIIDDDGLILESLEIETE